MKAELTGFDKLAFDLDAAARDLVQIVGRPKARGTIRKGLNLVIDDAKSRVHVVKNCLQPSILIRFSSKYDEQLIANMGVSYKYTRAHHAHLVEGGHKGPHPAPAHPFWAPAMAAQSGKALDAIVDAVNDLLDDHAV